MPCNSFSGEDANKTDLPSSGCEQLEGKWHHSQYQWEGKGHYEQRDRTKKPDRLSVLPNSDLLHTVSFIYARYDTVQDCSYSNMSEKPERNSGALLAIALLQAWVQLIRCTMSPAYAALRGLQSEGQIQSCPQELTRGDPKRPGIYL